MHVHANTDSTMISMQYTALDRDHQMSMYIAFALGLIIASWTSGNMIITWYGTYLLW